MKLVTLILISLSCLGFTDAEERAPEFALTKEYFDSVAVDLKSYPFTNDLESIDEGIAGVYSYRWSIGWPTPEDVIQAAALGDYDKVLLGWWIAKDRAARVTALALYYCSFRSIPGRSDFPNFAAEAKRFGVAEAEARHEEIEFARSNYPYFVGWLKSLVSKKLPEEGQLRRGLSRKRIPSFFVNPEGGR